MGIKHYASITTNKNVVPQNKTRQVDTTNILDIRIPKSAYRVVLFDRIVSEIEFGGKKMPVATKRINQKIYHIGRFETLESLTRKDPLFVTIAKADGCIGMVTSYNGVETLVFEGEGIIDPLNNEDKITKECKAIANKVDAVAKASSTTPKHTTSMKKTAKQTQAATEKENKNIQA